MSTLLLSHSPSSDLLPDQCSAITFSIDGHICALPMPVVTKVVRLPEPVSCQYNGPNCLLIDERPTTVLNLYPQFGLVRTSTTAQPSSQQMTDIALLVNSTEAQTIAVLIDAPPRLISLSLKETHPLPLSYRRAIGAIAPCVAIHPTYSMVLLLDLDQEFMID
ncbi:MAG: chemotaxis protein CheW [Leptolyngbyaceae bacterium]|nr:chemotaxis protein CheW [Leptolyngbyaceae bacterium]